jgi:hypothetical protein
LYVSHDGKTWEEVKIQTPDYENNIIYGTLTKLSYVGLAGEIRLFAENLQNLIVYPNPYIPSKGHRFIYFGNITQDATIRIYDLSGALVKQIKVEECPQRWDAKSDGIASGIYIYIVKDPREHKIGKIAIIR